MVNVNVGVQNTWLVSAHTCDTVHTVNIIINLDVQNTRLVFAHTCDTVLMVNINVNVQNTRVGICTHM